MRFRKFWKPNFLICWFYLLCRVFEIFFIVQNTLKRWVTTSKAEVISAFFYSMADKLEQHKAELVAEQEELLRKQARLITMNEKLLQERALLDAENKELIQKLNSYRSAVKEFIMSQATMENLNMASILDYILYINEALIVCDVGLKERRLILSQKLPQKYSTLLKNKHYSDGQRLKMAIVRIEKQFHTAGGCQILKWMNNFT